MKNSSRKALIQPILWAAAIIGSAILLRGTEHAESMFLILLALASTSVIASGNARNDLHCLKAKLGGKDEQ